MVDGDQILKDWNEIPASLISLYLPFEKFITEKEKIPCKGFNTMYISWCTEN